MTAELTAALSAIANVGTALTVLVVGTLGILELRRARRERDERAAFAVVRAMMTPEWIDSVVLVQSLPDGVGLAEVETDERVKRAVHSVGIILEGLGYAVFSRIVQLDTVDELVGGVVRVAQRKLQQYIDAERQRSGSHKSWEWFEWLSVQLDLHATGKTALDKGAYEVYRDWQP